MQAEGEPTGPEVAAPAEAAQASAEGGEEDFAPGDSDNDGNDGVGRGFPTGQEVVKGGQGEGQKGEGKKGKRKR